MIVLNNIELQEINGGASISSTMVNAISRLASTFLLLGQLVGSAIKNSIRKNYC